ncbi:MAG: histidine--tRNA ligase [Spirochaetaceae bacterium]|jgi:histidyl-tRNA synthetase|nr:histidine--tRNA ligase [Spirochaetaceae bacterium]
MADIITPKILKGFRDFLPGAEIKRRDLVERIEKSFRSYGFVPIDTPVLEYAEILLGKGGGETEKQIYRFHDHGGRDVALRFDLTVPFARFLAEHRSELTLPFKRYHIAKVWRGENTQRGRYREFTQCDFDIVGSDSPAADFEILLLMRDTLSAIGAGEVTIRLNHRGLFNRFLAKINAGEKSPEILRIVDKLAKIGREETGKLLGELLGEARAQTVLGYIEAHGSYEDTLRTMTRFAQGDTPGDTPESDRLWMLRRFMEDTGTAASFVLDPSITRGLDYYTGVVYETFLPGLPEIGSVCSGGRYDNLAGLYSREKIPGVGSSIGLDRLIAALETLEKNTEKNTCAPLVIACIREEDAGAYQRLAGRFREAGIACEVFFEPKKLTQQFILAEKKGARWVAIPAGEAPLDSPLTLRKIALRKDQEHLSWEEVARIIQETP